VQATLQRVVADDKIKITRIGDGEAPDAAADAGADEGHGRNQQ
jgi:hypothetical protein